MRLSRTLIVWLIFIAFQIGITHPGKIIQSYKMPSSFPTGLTFDGKHLWLADYKEDKLITIDPASGKVVGSISSPGFWPMGLTYDGQYLWNIDKKQKKIFQVDPGTGTILNAIDAPSNNPEGLAWDGHTIWVSDPRSDEIMKLDLSDGTAVKTFPAPSTYAQGLTFDGTYLWCSDRIRDEIYMIDPETGEVIIIIDSPGPYTRGMAWDGEHLWNVDYQTDRLYKLIRQDDEKHVLKDTRHSRVTFTHQAKIFGNGQLKELNTYIALPEDLTQQEIISTNIFPEEFSEVEDRWHQRFAHIQTKNAQSEETIQSVMFVEARISAIDYFIFPDQVGSLTDIPDKIKNLYTANGSKYLIDDPYIQNLKEKIVGDEKNPYWIARKIFDYVRNTLEYKLEGGWNVAPVVLDRGTGSCSEYTFGFIALCRAAGLPARFVGSIVVRGDDASLDEVFHRWPEIYLPNYGWIPIDPQGGDKPQPRDRAMNIGHLPNRFLITTQGGGDSEYLGWYYNSHESYKTDPQIKVNIEAFAEWEPLETPESAKK